MPAGFIQAKLHHLARVAQQSSHGSTGEGGPGGTAQASKGYHLRCSLPAPSGASFVQDGSSTNLTLSSAVGQDPDPLGQNDGPGTFAGQLATALAGSYDAGDIATKLEQAIDLQGIMQHGQAAVQQLQNLSKQNHTEFARELEKLKKNFSKKLGLKVFRVRFQILSKGFQSPIFVKFVSKTSKSMQNFAF